MRGNTTDERDVEVVLRVQGEAECVATGDTSENTVVTVAA